jgi:EAL domain-containing protein (putative c-di-GMP-specific phosphodiesterase class I)
MGDMAGERAIAEAVLAEAEKSVNKATDASLVGIAKALHAVRKHLNMEIGFISEFMGDSRVFRYVDAGTDNPPIHAGQSMSMQDGYCLKVVNGDLPEMIPDTALVPAAMAIPATTQLPIGSHMSVPIRMSNGAVYGTFCCFSALPDRSLNERDLNVMRTVADLVAWQVETSASEAASKAGTTQQIQSAIARREPEIVYQSIFRLKDGSPFGAEALARFSREPALPPERWFEKAGMVGLRTNLEIAAVTNAITGYEVCWAGKPSSRLAVSVSAATVIARDLVPIISLSHYERLILEVTSVDASVNVEKLDKALAPLRAAGIMVAACGVGSEYTGLTQVLRLRPDIIKLDVDLTKNIDGDSLKRTLAAAVAEHATEIGCMVLAEGIDSQAELTTLTELGIDLGRGNFLVRPGSVVDVIRQRSLLIG